MAVSVVAALRVGDRRGASGRYASMPRAGVDRQSSVFAACEPAPLLGSYRHAECYRAGTTRQRGKTIRCRGWADAGAGQARHRDAQLPAYKVSALAVPACRAGLLARAESAIKLAAGRRCRRPAAGDGSSAFTPGRDFTTEGSEDPQVAAGFLIPLVPQLCRYSRHATPPGRPCHSPPGTLVRVPGHGVAALLLAVGNLRDDFWHLMMSRSNRHQSPSMT